MPASFISSLLLYLYLYLYIYIVLQDSVDSATLASLSQVMLIQQQIQEQKQNKTKQKKVTNSQKTKNTVLAPLCMRCSLTATLKWCLA